MGPADLRSKTKSLDKKVTDVKELPVWNYDGSSTNQAPGLPTHSLQLLTSRNLTRPPAQQCTGPSKPCLASSLCSTSSSC